MSYKAQQWVLEQTDIRGVDKWVLFMLAYRDNHEDPHGCFPSLNRMAKDCGFSRSTVQASIERLKKSGKVRVENRTDNKGDADSNWYTLPLVWVCREPVHPMPGAGTQVYRQPVPNHKRTRIQPRTRVQGRDARNQFDDEMEQRRKLLARDKRVDHEDRLRSELSVGSGPEVVRIR